MAKNTYTPVSYWESLTIPRFYRWVQANNRVCREEERALERIRK